MSFPLLGLPDGPAMTAPVLRRPLQYRQDGDGPYERNDGAGQGWLIQQEEEEEADQADPNARVLHDMPVLNRGEIPMWLMEVYQDGRNLSAYLGEEGYLTNTFKELVKDTDFMNAFNDDQTRVILGNDDTTRAMGVVFAVVPFFAFLLTYYADFKHVVNIIVQQQIQNLKLYQLDSFEGFGPPYRDGTTPSLYIYDVYPLLLVFPSPKGAPTYVKRVETTLKYYINRKETEKGEIIALLNEARPDHPLTLPARGVYYDPNHSKVHLPKEHWALHGPADVVLEEGSRVP